MNHVTLGVSHNQNRSIFDRQYDTVLTAYRYGIRYAEFVPDSTVLNRTKQYKTVKPYN